MALNQEYYLKEIAEIKSGKRLPMGHSLVDEVTKYPYIKARDIRGGKVRQDQFQYLRKETQKLIKRYIVETGDVCITIVANIGDVGIVPPALNGVNLTENAVRLTKFKDFVSPFYVNLLLSSKAFKDYMELLAAGAAQSKLGIYKIEKIKVALPSLVVQQRIASILTAYDDLIEVNNHRIKLLEETARELYKEWFVRMRFPGYQEAKFVKGVPEGWEEKKVKEIVDRRKFGKTYRPEELQEHGQTIVIDQSTDPNLGYHNNIPDHNATSENPIIIFGDHSCKMQLMIEPFSLAENVIPFVSKGSLPIYYLFRLVESLVETTEYKRHWNELISKSVFVGTHDLQVRYSKFVKPFFEQIEILKQQNTHLGQIRDRFLPRLISGKLEV